MLIVAGWIAVGARQRDDYVENCRAVVQQARAAAGCHDFAISADLLVPTRINIFERWETEAELMAFRGSGPDDEQSAEVRDAAMGRYEISSVGEV